MYSKGKATTVRTTPLASRAAKTKVTERMVNHTRGRRRIPTCAPYDRRCVTGAEGRSTTIPRNARTLTTAPKTKAVDTEKFSARYDVSGTPNANPTVTPANTFVTA